MESHDQAQLSDALGLRRGDLTNWMKREWTMRLGRALASWFQQMERVLVQASFDKLRDWAFRPFRHQPVLLVLSTSSPAHGHPRTVSHFVRI